MRPPQRVCFQQTEVNGFCARRGKVLKKKNENPPITIGLELFFIFCLLSQKVIVLALFTATPTEVAHDNAQVNVNADTCSEMDIFIFFFAAPLEVEKYPL